MSYSSHFEVLDLDNAHSFLGQELSILCLGNVFQFYVEILGNSHPSLTFDF
jgi:hypothetical protein